MLSKGPAKVEHSTKGSGSVSLKKIMDYFSNLEYFTKTNGLIAPSDAFILLYSSLSKKALKTLKCRDWETHLFGGGSRPRTR